MPFLPENHYIINVIYRQPCHQSFKPAGAHLLMYLSDFFDDHLQNKKPDHPNIGRTDGENEKNGGAIQERGENDEGDMG